MAAVTGVSPAWRVVLALAAIVVGIIVTASVGSVVIAAGGWDINVSAASGAEIGRTSGQVAAGAPLDDNRIPLGVAVMLNLPLWACLVGAPLWGISRGIDWHRDLWWSFDRRDIPIGLGIGIVTQFLLLPLVYIPIFWIFGPQDVSALSRDLVAAVDTPFDVVALVVLTVIGAPLAEEILFRGLLHRGLVEMHADRGRFGMLVATAGSSVVFGAIHFQLLQFPGLVLFGVVAAVAMMRSGRLSTAIFTHVGFNLSTVTILLLERF